MSDDIFGTASQEPLIVLASGSPRRRFLFEYLGIPHEVRIADVDERGLKAASAREFALKAALVKATALDTEVPLGTVVVAADTVVALNSRLYFKPENRNDAIRMLEELAGNTHQVITGVAVREVGRATQLDAVTTDVKIRDLNREEIEAYVDTGEPMDKAGSYAIQGLGGTLVERITGDYFNVVGLPVDKLLSMLESHRNVDEFRRRRRDLTPEVFR